MDCTQSAIISKQPNNPFYPRNTARSVINPIIFMTS